MIRLVCFVIIAVCAYAFYYTFCAEPFDPQKLNISCIKNTSSLKSIRTTDLKLSNKIIITRINKGFPIDKIQVQQKIRYGQSYFEDNKKENSLSYTIKEFDKNYNRIIYTHWLYRNDGSRSYFFSKNQAEEFSDMSKNRFDNRFSKISASELDGIIDGACTK